MEEDYMESSPTATRQVPLTPLKEEQWEGRIPPQQCIMGNTMVTDPAVEDALVHINAPRQTNKMDETYQQQRAAAIPHGSRMPPEEVDN
jgi:hypothetical protein